MLRCAEIETRMEPKILRQELEKRMKTTRTFEKECYRNKRAKKDFERQARQQGKQPRILKFCCVDNKTLTTNHETETKTMTIVVSVCTEHKIKTATKTSKFFKTTENRKRKGLGDVGPEQTK